VPGVMYGKEVWFAACRDELVWEYIAVDMMYAGRV